MASYPSDFANGSNNTNKLSPQELSIQLFTHSAVQIIQINLVLKNKKGAHCACFFVQIIQINLVLKNLRDHPCT